MTKFFLLIFSLLIFLAGCSGEVPDVPGIISSPTPEHTATSTLTPTPTTPTPTPTLTPTPTRTPFPSPTPTCSQRHGEAFVSSLRELSLRWVDAITIADSTSRINLGDPVAEMQKIRRETLLLEVPTCAAPAQDELVAHMDSSIDGFLAFMTQEEDSVVSYHFDESFDHYFMFLDEISKIGADPSRFDIWD